jgi:hypothetical protein
MKLMKTKWTLLLIGVLGGIAPTAPLAQGPDLPPMVVSNLTGDLRVQQSTPATCNNVDQTTPVTQGRLEITPAEGVDVPGGKFFVLTRANVSFEAFSIHVSCLGGTVSRTRSYTNVDVQLGRAVSFTASPSAPGIFEVTIPKDDFLIYESAIVDGESETGYKSPKEDVTGTIDLEHGTVQMHVVIATRVHFGPAGCLPYVGCAIDEDRDGTLTADLAGTIVFPDADVDGVPDRSDNCRFLANPDQSPVATPVVTAPSDVTLASCAVSQFGGASAADVCDGGPVTVTNDAPHPFPRGTTVVTWTAQDAKGRVGSDTQAVTVVDTTPPTFTSVPADIAMNDCGPANLGLPIAVDDCEGTPALTNNAPAKFLVGATVVTWTATDLSGNHAIATQTVTVTDTVAPAVSCVPGGNPSGHGHGGGGFFQVSSIDACTDFPTIRLGSFVLANGETIKITETGKSGVRLVNVMGPAQIKHFHVGRGEGVITATDPSSNVGSASCQ